jgi:hypothetical protein
LFDRKGNYIKTNCILFWAQTYDNACKNVSMDLFIVDTYDIGTDLLHLAISIFSSGSGEQLWINGKREIDGDWYKQDNSKYLLHKDLIRVFNKTGSTK